MLDEIRDKLSLMIAYRYNNLIVGDNADGHGDKRDAMLATLHGDTQDGEQPVALCFRARTFVRIGDVFQK